MPAAIYFFGYFHRIAPAVVAGDLMRAFSISAASLGNLSAIYPYVFAFMALPAGSFADTLGPRWTLALGSGTMGVGAVLFGLAPQFGVAWVGRLLVGLGASVILISSLRLAAEWFRPQEFATISGWSQTVGNVGALVASSPLALLVEMLGWRQSFVMIGTLTLLLAGAAALFVRDRPEAMGLVPVNPGPVAAAMPSLSETLRGIPGIFSNPRSWPPVLATTGIYSSLIAFLGLWGVPYLTQVYGLGRVEASTYPSLLAIGIVVGAPLVGWLSDRWLGLRRLPFIAFTAVYTACWALLALPGEMRLPLGALAPVLLLMGFASSGLVLVFVCVREVNDPARVGITLGFCNLPVFLGFALVQWLTGLILDARWEGLIAGGARIYPASAWEATFAFCLAMALAALVLTFFIAETRCRNIWQPR
ncbi:MAG: MFS transporter [Candidatus Rokubacteria bacterium]|nr:MFS transporter [Candidatus Rokubacteria bacterium]